MIRKVIRKWLKMRKIKKICAANRHYCPDCIYREYIFDGAIFRGIRCKLVENDQLKQGEPQ